MLEYNDIQKIKMSQIIKTKYLSKCYYVLNNLNFS